jgi:sporulation protein YlmC with PRC-barrel domain
MTRTQEIDTLLRAGGAVVGPDGERIGTLSQVFVDDRTGNPAWVTVHTGLFGISETFVPLGDAAVRENEIVVPYRASTVVDAPRTVNSDEQLSEADAARLYRYYGLDHEAGSDAPHLRKYVATEPRTVDDLDNFRTWRRGGL